MKESLSESATKTVQPLGGGIAKKQRNSNLELLRIFAMMAIIAHHFVVNSTVDKQYDYLNPTLNHYFLEIWGMWGKTAINSFILISGYFLLLKFFLAYSITTHLPLKGFIEPFLECFII